MAKIYSEYAERSDGLFNVWLGKALPLNDWLKAPKYVYEWTLIAVMATREEALEAARAARRAG